MQRAPGALSALCIATVAAILLAAAGPAAATYRGANGKLAFVSTEASSQSSRRRISSPSTKTVRGGRTSPRIPPRSSSNRTGLPTGGRSCSRARATETARST
jgi:hypothetical protein